MLDVILISPVEMNIELLRTALSGEFDVQAYQDKPSLFISDGQSYLILEEDKTLPIHYTADELSKIYAQVEQPAFYVLGFKKTVMLQKFLDALSQIPNLMIDNDHDLITTVTEFSAFLEAHPGLSWSEIVLLQKPG